MTSLLKQAYANGKEKEKARQTELYTRLWSKDKDYGTADDWVHKTCEFRIMPHLREVCPAGVAALIDFGAGNGKFLAGLSHVYEVGTGVDLYKPDTLPNRCTWLQQALWEPVAGRYGYAISTDTLEHLPQWAVPESLANIKEAAPHGFLRISTRPDRYGSTRGLVLHETVQPPEWWIEKTVEAGFRISKYTVYLGQAIEIYY